MNLHSPVTDLKGIGEKTAVPFAKAGIHTVQDLIEYYPRAYELFEEPTEPEEMEDGKKYAVHVWVQSVSPVKRFKRYQIFSAQLKTGDTVIQAAWLICRFFGIIFRKAGSIFSEELSRSETGNIEWNSQSITRWLIMRIFCI